MVVFGNVLSSALCRYAGDKALGALDRSLPINEPHTNDSGTLDKKYENRDPVVRGVGDTEEGRPIITMSSYDMELFKNVPTGINDTPNEQKIEVEAELNRGRGQLGSDLLDYRDILEDKVRKKRALVEKNRIFRWKDGRVFYKIYQDQTSQSDNFQLEFIENTIRAAMLEISRKTCIRFTQDNSGHDDDGCSLVIMKGNECHTSNAGRKIKIIQSKTQCDFTRMSLAPSECKKGTVMHELLHAIGFHHEHQRPDRDGYVRIKETKQDEARSSNVMRKTKEDKVDTLGTKYDYRSIMHYPKLFDVLDKKWLGMSSRVNEEKERLYDLDRNQSREELSEIDIFAINKYYGCVNCKNVDNTEEECQKLKDRDVDFCRSPYRKSAQGCLGFCGFKCPDPKKFEHA